MAQRPISVVRIAAPLRTFAQRFAFVLLLGAAITIMIVGRTDPAVFDRTRMTVTDFFAPLLSAIAQPVATGAQIVSDVEAMFDLRAENERLRLENQRLLAWQSAARVMQAENTQLRKLLAYDPQDAATFTTARIVGDRGGAFLRSLLISEGTRAGIAKGQAAVTGEGLLGRVASVGERSARILQITDLNSRIPVVVEETRERAVLAGDNSADPKLVFFSANAFLKEGQRVVTSGHGDVFPPGIPVGIIQSVGENGVRVRPFATSDRLEFVRLVDYGKTGILKQEITAQ